MVAKLGVGILAGIGALTVVAASLVLAWIYKEPLGRRDPGDHLRDAKRAGEFATL